jgi:uncharacterized repeat protein (TIGR03803 family)
VLHQFQGADGCAPAAGLIIAANGTIYSTTSNGGTANKGTIFELSPQ